MHWHSRKAESAQKDDDCKKTKKNRTHSDLAEQKKMSNVSEQAWMQANKQLSRRITDQKIMDQGKYWESIHIEVRESPSTKRESGQQKMTGNHLFR